MNKPVKPVPEDFRTITPHLVVRGVARAVEFYRKAFGAEELYRNLGPDGVSVMHSELLLGDSRFFVNDVMMGAKSPRALGGSPMSLWVYVADADALFNRATAAGAQVAPGPMGHIQDQFWGDRTGTVIDPAGYQWTIATHKEDFTPQEMKQRQEEFMKAFAAQSSHS